MYSPEQFGAFGLILTLSIMLAYLLTMRIDAAIAIPVRDSEAKALARLSVLLALGLTPIAIVSGLAVVHLTTWSDSLANVPYWELGLPLLALFTALGATVGQYAVRKRVYRAISRTSMLSALATGVAQVLIGLFSGLGLLFGSILGKMVGPPALARATGLLRREPGEMRYSSRELLRRYWRFPVLFMPAGLMSMAGGQLPMVLLPVIYGLDVAGQYAMANRVLAIPATLLGVAVGSVFLGELAASRHVGGDAPLRLFYRWTLFLVVPAVGMIFFVLLLGPTFIMTFLGPQWELASDFSVILVWGISVAFVAQPIHGVWTVFERGWVSSGWQFVRLISSVGIMWGASDRGWTVQTCMIAISAWNVLAYALSWVSCWLVLRKAAGAPPPLDEGRPEHDPNRLPPEEEFGTNPTP